MSQESWSPLTPTGVPKEPTQAPCLKNGQYLHIDYAEGFLQTRLIKFFKNVPQLLAPPHP